MIQHVTLLIKFLPAVLSAADQDRVEALGLLLHHLSLDVGLTAVVEGLDVGLVGVNLWCFNLFICIKLCLDLLRLIQRYIPRIIVHSTLILNYWKSKCRQRTETMMYLSQGRLVIKLTWLTLYLILKIL